MPWKDTFITPHPESKNELFLHREGERLVWWNLNGASLEEDAFVEVIQNKIPDETKRYSAIQVSSNLAPDRIEFETFDQESYLDAPEMEYLDGMWRSPVKHDSTQSGTNEGEDMMRGRFMLIRFIFSPRSINAIRNAVLKYRHMARSMGR